MHNQNLATPQSSNITGSNNMPSATQTGASAHNQNSLNSVTGSGANSGIGKSGGHMHRRFPSRYFNSNKERPLFLRNQNHTSNHNGQNLNNHSQTDYNNNNGSGGNNKYASSLKSNSGGQYNSNRSNTPNSSHSHTSGQNTKAVNTNTVGMGVGGSSGVASLAVSVAEHGMPSPQGSFDNATSGGKMITQVSKRFNKMFKN